MGRLSREATCGASQGLAIWGAKRVWFSLPAFVLVEKGNISLG